MNEYECDGTRFCMMSKVKCITQQGEAELNRVLNISPNVKSHTIAKNEHHLLFVLYSAVLYLAIKACAPVDRV